MDTFDRIWDRLYPIAVFIIFSALIPLMLWGFFAQNTAYKKKYSKPSSYEVVVSEDRAMLARVVEKQRRREHLPIQEKEEDLPTPQYFPGDDDFNIPLEQLLEGNHGRFL
jgi:hypothetical protein